MHVTNIQRFATVFTIAAAFIMGYLAHGFDQLGVDVGVIGSAAAVILFMWLVWDLLD